MRWWYENEEERMEFDKSRVYTALNADELRAGDKVIAACAISTLKWQIERDSRYIKVREIYRIADDKTDHRFRFRDGGQPSAPFAYLVERKKEREMRKVTLIDYDKTGKQFERDVVIPENEGEIRAMNGDWNYVADGLPSKQDIGTSDRVLIAETGNEQVRIGYYDHELGEWFADGSKYPINVYAWMAIKPPKEEA